MFQTKISLVTTVLNDRLGTALFFRQMAEQTRPPDEIVIVDSCSSDGTWEVIETERAQPQGPWKVSAWQLHCNVARGRNLAIERSAHDLIVSTDVGCNWEPAWIEELIQPLQANPNCQAVMGSWAVRWQDLGSVWARVEYALLQEPKLIARLESDASSRSIAYHRSLWGKIGGYPEDLTLAGDDMVFSIILHQIVSAEHISCAPMIRCYWQRPEALRAFCKEARRNFKGAGEAGIWQDFGWKTGGRMLAEIVLPFTGLLLVFVEQTVLGIMVLAMAIASLGLRLARLRKSVRLARHLGIRQPWLRLFIFEWITKAHGVIGYWAGRRRGATNCRACRQRLSATSG